MAHDLTNQTIEITVPVENRAASPVESQPGISALWIHSFEPDAAEILRTYVDALSRLSDQCELVIVVNGNSGEMPEIENMLRHATVPVRVLQLHRKCDESTAMRLGMERARGELLILLPTYIQSDPRALDEMISEISRGADYVASWRFARVDSKWSALKSHIFNSLTRYVTGIKLHDVNSGLRVMKAIVPQNLPIYGDLHRFMPILAATHGFRVSEVKTRHVEERVKKGDYAFGVYVRRILDMLTLFFLFKFTKKPLRFFGLIGSATAAAGCLVSGVLVTQRLMGQSLADRPAFLLGILLIVLGVNLVSLGLLGELIIFIHGHRVLDYHVKEVYENRSGP